MVTLVDIFVGYLGNQTQDIILQNLIEAQQSKSVSQEDLKCIEKKMRM